MAVVVVEELFEFVDEDVLVLGCELERDDIFRAGVE